MAHPPAGPRRWRATAAALTSRLCPQATPAHPQPPLPQPPPHLPAGALDVAGCRHPLPSLLRRPWLGRPLSGGGGAAPSPADGVTEATAATCRDVPPAPTSPKQQAAAAAVGAQRRRAAGAARPLVGPPAPYARAEPPRTPVRLPPPPLPAPPEIPPTACRHNGSGSQRDWGDLADGGRRGCCEAPPRAATPRSARGVNVQVGVPSPPPPG